MHIAIGEGIGSVLVVEDEGIVAIMMEDLLREMGVREVHSCADLATALEVARTADIDCAVLDIWLRDSNTNQIADVLTARNIPFVFSTGSGVEALEATHHDRPVLSKPFADEDFKLVLLDTWTLAQSHRQRPKALSAG